MAQGQQGSGSPYSAYGLGEFVGAIPVAQTMMGGLGAAVVDPVSTVIGNPASYTALHRTTFETGLQVRSSTFANEATQSNGRHTDILGLTLGVPFGKGRWGMAVGVRPISQVGYRLTSSAALPSGTGQVAYTYTGDGGLNQGFIGVAHTISQKRDSLSNGHRLSLGANVGYLFGRIERSATATFPTGQGYYGTRVTSSLLVRDPTADLGLHYQGDLRKRLKKEDEGLYYLVGVTAELPVDLGARRSDVVNTFGFSGAGVEVPLDTAYVLDGARGTIGLPLGLGVGATVFNEHWTFGVEYKQRDWSTLQVDVEGYTPPGKLASNTTLIAGVSYRPAREGSTSFWERTIYRAGLRQNNDYLVVGGTQLKERSASFGLSLPLMSTSTRSRLNIGAELGERGSLGAGLLRERYATLLVGITITPDVREAWFKKRRID